jgi:UDP-N-acetylmuramoyl-tripeptide--D-alanyl-D-alanine ligase
MNEPLWTFEEIAAAAGAAAGASGVAGGVSIDSRTLRRGDLFAAIKGENADGHKFVTAAFEKGAAAAIVELGFDPGSNLPLFRVRDTLQALNGLARAARKRSGARIAAVTGSVGKTGTKEMLRLMLSTAGPAHASEKSYNNLWGVPLSLARMPEATRFGAFEIGMNHAGEITPLTRLVRPHLAIVTWVAPVHLEFFSSAEEIADAKAEIFEGFEQGGAAILPSGNGHFERMAAKARKRSAEVVAFGEEPQAAARLLSFEALGFGSKVTANILGSKVEFLLGAPGKHLASNALAALAAVKLMGADLTAAAAVLAHFEAPEGRGRRERFETPEGAVLIIDETYNANPASMRAALSVLGAVPRADYPRRIAVLGDMLELGNAAPQFHAGLACVVDSHDIDLVFCAGPLMAHLYERLPAEKRGGTATSSAGLLPVLLEAVRGGDAVTIKGSLASRMGLLADALRSNLAAPKTGKQDRKEL